jgi:hypothetical protein
VTAAFGATLRDALAQRDGGAIGVAARIDDVPTLAAWRPESRDEPAFLVYSINKTLLAAVALSLVEDGRLALDATLDRFVPEVPHAARITVEQLLRHTAGIPNYGATPAYHEAVRTHPETPWSFEEFAAQTWRGGLQFEPGERFEYSNPGYMLVRAVVEQAGGTTYAELLRNRIARSSCDARTWPKRSPICASSRQRRRDSFRRAACATYATCTTPAGSRMASSRPPRPRSRRSRMRSSAANWSARSRCAARRSSTPSAKRRRIGASRATGSA